MELLYTSSAGDAEQFARNICARHENPVIMVAGGDGTVNSVVNGMSPAATLALVPIGTANVLALELGINSIDDALARITSGKTIPLSVGQLDNGREQRLFVLMAGIGLDGSVCEKVTGTGKKLLGKGVYLLSALQRLLFWEKGKLAVTIDGREIICHSLVICNSAHYGGSFRLALATDIFSPGLEVVCFQDCQRGTYLKLAFNLFTGRKLSKEDVTRIPAQTIKVMGRKAVQIDGDFFGYSPVIVRTIEGHGSIIV